MMTTETTAPLLQHFVHGEWLAAADTEWTADRNPSDATHVVARVPQGSTQVVEEAVAAASSAQEHWARLPGPHRAELLHRAAQALAKTRDFLAKIVASEVGKPLGEAYGEVDRGIAILRYFAEEAVHPIGQVIPALSAGSLQFSLRRPLGVIGVVSPWNFPVAIPLWKLAPALAFGNTIVWKPAETASLVATHLAQIFAEAEFPSGVFNLVLGKGSVVGDALTQHPALAAITFTGSDSVGMSIAARAARANQKYQVEMGGKNAAIVLADAHLPQAAQLVGAGAMRFAGQKCTATSRVIVEKRVLEPFLAQLTEAIHALPVAPADAPNSAVGPLISAESVATVERYAQAGAERGRIILGGQRLTHAPLSEGYFFAPTVVTDLSPDDPIAQEEIFGPLLTVLAAHDLDDAIRIANGTKYGLSVSLFTRDITAALTYIDRVDAGMVRVNGDTTGVDPHAPFGGMRGSSSHSREQGPAAIEFFTEIKTVHLNPTPTD